jgi:purine-binding chemotaxis protein CheW
MSVSSITDTKQYLTFRIGEEDFALEVSNVREILEFTAITKVPKTPEYMRGVINLRGSVVPVLDMRLKFNLAEKKETIDTCIIVLEVDIDGEKTIIGALIDSVQEVFELDPQHIEPAPKIGTRLRTDFIKGMGKREDRFIIILNIDKVFSSEELSAVQEVGRDEPMMMAGNE